MLPMNKKFLKKLNVGKFLMNILNPIKEFLLQKDIKTLSRIILGYIVLMIIGVTGFLLYHRMIIDDLKTKYSVLVKSAKKIEASLNEYQTVLQQKKQVDDILAKDKNFYIKEYFQKTASANNMNNIGQINTTDQKLENGYSEEVLQAKISGVSTQQMVTFLQKLEENQRVYIKMVDITKEGAGKTISFSVSIATVKPKEEKTA
jgi:type II secretory pathway component PulM